MYFTHVRNITGGTIKKIKIEFILGGSPQYREKYAIDRTKMTQTVNLHIKRKSVPPVDYTYVLNFTGGAIKKTKIEFIQVRGLSSTTKTAREQTKLDSDGQFTYKTKTMYHRCTSHMYVTSLEVLKKN